MTQISYYVLRQDSSRADNINIIGFDLREKRSSLLLLGKNRRTKQSYQSVSNSFTKKAKCHESKSLGAAGENLHHVLKLPVDHLGVEHLGHYRLPDDDGPGVEPRTPSGPDAGWQAPAGPSLQQEVASKYGLSKMSHFFTFTK